MRVRFVHVQLSVLLLCVPALAQALPVGVLSPERVGRICFGSRDTNGALDCWLTQHPDVASAMRYSDSTFSGTWPTWPVPVKNQMRLYFNQMVLWYKAGMPSTFPHPFPMPIPAGGPFQHWSPGGLDTFWMVEDMGKRVYLSQVGNSLAAELTGAFSWTITTYTPDQLALLLAMDDTMYYQASAPSPGYFFQYNGPSPGVPGYTVTFFKNQHLIGTDATDTVARLFAWERILIHFFAVSGESSATIYANFWGANTPPIPDPKIIKGTTYAGSFNYGFGHFTAGCSGTQDFMKSVLRSVNIPVERHWLNCQHATPIFPTVGLAMTHGDDPYDQLGLVSPFPGFGTPVPIEYFVTVAQHTQLFPATQSIDACLQNLSIQVANVAIKYGSDYLMNFYCQDLASGADHASGQVYNYMKNWYPLQTLETMGLWTTLSMKVALTNYCGM